MKRRKKKKTKAAYIFIGMGTVLILSALLLFLHNFIEDKRGGRIAGETLSEMQAVIEQRRAQEAEKEAAGLSGEKQGEPDETDNPFWEDPSTWPDTDFEMMPEDLPEDFEMPEITVSEISYVGVISLPVLGIELPVMAPGNFNHLDVAPICQFGSPQTNNFVIAAHNTNSFFGRIDSMQPGDPVTFTDVNGRVYRYVVSHGELLQVGQVSEARNNGHALGLYTCAYDGTLRFIVLCDRA